ncbi:hypothetical protein Tco_1381830, partial [Tanacetum coccineum]
SWVVVSLQRQRVGAMGGATEIDPKAPQDAPVGKEDDQPDPSPQQAPQMPQAAALTPRTIIQRLQRVEEEVQRLS